MCALLFCLTFHLSMCGTEEEQMLIILWSWVRIPSLFCNNQLSIFAGSHKKITVSSTRNILGGVPQKKIPRNNLGILMETYQNVSGRAPTFCI